MTMRIRSFEAVKTPRINSQPTNALSLHTPVLPRFPEKIRRLVDAAYAAHGGAHQMTLDEWRGVEEELKRKLVNEYYEQQQ